jgi:transcriptional regulator with XRE-family HTH domain
MPILFHYYLHMSLKRRFSHNAVSATQRNPVSISLNVRFRLQQKQIPRDKWGDWLSKRLPDDANWLAKFVRGEIQDRHIGQEQLGRLSVLFGLGEDGEELRFQDFLPDDCNVLLENINYLVDGLEHGGKRTLASELGVDPTTVSRWLSGKIEPSGTTRSALASYFNLPPNTDLRTDPVFLSVEPISIYDQRQWVKQRLDSMCREEFAPLYPALRRMLEEK